MLPKYTYYYGFSKDEVIKLAEMPYKEALELKINAAKGLAERLLQGSYIDSDTNRVNAVQKAIKFNQELLEELKL